MSGFWQSLVATAAEVYEPNDGWGVAGLLVIGLPSTITAVMGGFILVRQHKSDKKIEDVKTKQQESVGTLAAAAGTLEQVKSGVDETISQVVNNHADKPVLRDDLDRKFIEMIQAVGKLETAIAVERAERTTAIAGIENQLAGLNGYLRAR